MTSHNTSSSVAKSYKSLRILAALGEVCFAVVAGVLMIWAVAPLIWDLVSSEPSTIAAPQSNPVPYRADIVDRNGTILARSVTSAAVYAIPELVRSVTSQDTHTLLLQVFPDLDPDELAADLCSERNRILITNRVSASKQRKLFDLGLVGVEIVPKLLRLYPQGQLTSHVVGYVKRSEQQGGGGVEQHWNQQIISLHEHDQSLQMTIDIRLQYIMWEELRDQIKHSKAIGGSGIILDVPTREILAAVSLSDFDPHNPDPQNIEYLDRNFASVYEAGSVFKIFNTAWAIESGDIQLTELIDTHSPIEGLDIEPPAVGAPRYMNIAEIFTFSSNLGSARIALRPRDGGLSQYQFMVRAGFDRPVQGVQQATASPLFPTRPDEWNLTERANISYGYRISVSPLHLIQATAAVVDDGYVRPLVLIKNQHGPSTPPPRLVSAQTIMQMRSLMRSVVTDGTGQLAELEGYGIGGKTGTAKAVVDGQYSSDQVRTSFIGVFPIDDPQFLIFVLIDGPNRDNPARATGGQVAAPVVRKVVAKMAALLGIEPRYPS